MPTSHDSRARAREAARTYFASHAISPRFAARVGVDLDDRGLTFPNGRRRPLIGEGPKFLNPKGKPLTAWWLRDGQGAPVVCEGEGDALAALTALKRGPKIAGLRTLPVVSVPGTGYPSDRLAAELSGRTATYLILDADEPGRHAALRFATALVSVGVRPIVVDLPDGSDLADWLAAIPSEDRGDRFANLLVDHEIDAPTLADIRRGEMVCALQERIAELEAAGVAYLPNRAERGRAA